LHRPDAPLAPRSYTASIPMSSKTVAVLVVAVLAAGGIAYWTTRKGASGAALESTAETVSRSAPDQPPAEGRVGGERTDASEPAHEAAQAEPAAERVDPGARRKVTEDEKEAIRELMRVHQKQTGGANADEMSADAAVPSIVPGTDPDSLFLKYGSMSEDDKRESLVSLRAILDWQDQGPFEDKSIELLAPEFRLAFEREIEWLERNLAGLD